VSATLGIAIGREELRAVAVSRRKVVWAAQARWSGAADLAEALSRLVTERPRGVHEVRVALEEGVCQRKVVERLPPLGARDLASHVALLPRRYFLQDGGALVTDATWLRGGGGNRKSRGPALLAAAAEPLVAAVAEGLRAAGLKLCALAPAADFVPPGVMGDGQALEAVPDGESLQSAYAAAAGRLPALGLFPEPFRAAGRRGRRAAAMRVLIAGISCIALAAACYVASLLRQWRSAEAELERSSPAVERALAVRRDLDASTEALAFLSRAEAGRPRLAQLLADLTGALPDSAFIAFLRVDGERRGTLVGYAPAAGRVVTALERVAAVEAPALDGPVMRDALGGREWDRFTIRFRLAAGERR
jgi:hypothetical protein